MTTDFVMPVYNEGRNVKAAIDGLYAALPSPKRVLVVYDFEEDDTVPVVRELQQRFTGLELIRNRHGRGVVNAIRTGIEDANGDVVIITMADLSDDTSIIPEMVRRIQAGEADIVCPSRYMKGGHQFGGPFVKRTLSRLAGLSLRFAGFPVHDATNAFRAYRRTLLQSLTIESEGGFAYSLELTAKAHAAGWKVVEIPSTWRDRSAGESRFRLMKWLPQYLKWYWFALTNRPRHK